VANAQIAEISRLKSEFLANMSHEAAHATNAILGFSEILQGQPGLISHRSSARSASRNIHASGKHLLELVNDRARPEQDRKRAHGARLRPLRRAGCDQRGPQRDPLTE